MVTDVRGSMFGFFFSKDRVKSFKDASDSDTGAICKGSQLKIMLE